VEAAQEREVAAEGDVGVRELQVADGCRVHERGRPRRARHQLHVVRGDAGIGESGAEPDARVVGAVRTLLRHRGRREQHRGDHRGGGRDDRSRCTSRYGSEVHAFLVVE
jgi:hypothetical protein